MAFLETGWGKTTVALNQPIQTLQSGVVVGAPTFYSYQSSTDNLATIGGADYFLDKAFELCVGDVIFCDGSDASSFRSVTTLTNTNVVTSALATSGAVGTANIDALAVTTAKIDNNAVTSAKLSVETIQYVKVSLSAADFNGAYAAPVVLIAAAGANKLIQVKQIMLELDYGTTQFAAGGVANAQYDSDANGAGVAASATVAAATVQGWAADRILMLDGAAPSAAATDTVNKGIYWSNQTAAFTTGDSTVDLHIWYSVITTTL
jgi:hypothetical protein